MLEKNKVILKVILTSLVIFGLIEVPCWLGSLVPDTDVAPIFIVWVLGVMMLAVVIVLFALCLGIFFGIYSLIDKLL
jgi:hypothetical protein